MASTNTHSIIELSAQSLQVAHFANGALQSHHEHVLDAKAEIAAVLGAVKTATVIAAPADSFVQRSTAEQAGSIRTTDQLLAHAKSLAPGATGVHAVACDTAAGKPVAAGDKSPWLIAGASNAELDKAAAQLKALGLAATPGVVTLSFPVQIGAAVNALQDAPETTRLLVLHLGEVHSHLALVAASGIEQVATVPAGFVQVFEAVQAELGLKFRAAASKLFFNEAYEFGDAAGRIAGRVADAFKPAVNALGGEATALHVVGLPASQAWFAQTLAEKLSLPLWKPDVARVSAQIGLQAAAAAATLPPSALGLLYLASRGGSSGALWLPTALGTAPAPAPTPVATAPAAAAPAPAARSVAPAPAPAAKPAPAPKPAPAGAPRPAPAPAPAPKPKPVPPAPVAKRPVSVSRPAAPSAPAATPSAGSGAATGGGGSGNMVKIIIGAVVAIAIVAVAAIFMMKGDDADTAGTATPAGSTGQTATSSQPERPAQPSAEDAARLARERETLMEDVTKNPRSCRNDRYGFEVSDKGIITKLTSRDRTVVIDQAGGVNLQGSYVGSDGKRTWFYAGGIENSRYTATVEKSLDASNNVVFNVNTSHPRFTMTQTYTCLPGSVDVAVKFTPVDLKDPRGDIAGVYAVWLNGGALSTDQKMRSSADSFTYTTSAGPVVLQYGNEHWSRTGGDDKQTVTAGENFASFYFTNTTDAARSSLAYSIQMP